VLNRSEERWARRGVWCRLEATRRARDLTFWSCSSSIWAKASSKLVDTACTCGRIPWFSLPATGRLEDAPLVNVGVFPIYRPNAQGARRD